MPRVPYLLSDRNKIKVCVLSLSKSYFVLFLFLTLSLFGVYFLILVASCLFLFPENISQGKL